MRSDYLPKIFVVDPLERRALLSNAIVTTTADSDTGSLRQAIIDIGTDDDATITFDIPGNGVHTIKLLSPLPAIEARVDIRGTTDSKGNPLIELDGSGAGANAIGLNLTRNTLNSRPSEISGLIINRFDGDGIVLSGNGPAEVFGCRIGTDASGKHSRPNGSDGIEIKSPNNRIGLPFAGAGFQNVISGNTVDGIFISSTAATSNVIQNCLIGTDAGGRFALGNLNRGIFSTAAHTQVGGAQPNQGNVVSGSTNGNGVDLNGSYNLVEGNFIGTNADGTEALPNQVGLRLFNADRSVVGGNRGARNVVSGNSIFGIWVTGTANSDVLRNFVGTNAAGTEAIGNESAGIALSDANGIVIINSVVSGNGIGIQMSDSNPQINNQIEGCRIGTDVLGKFPIPNLEDGVQISGAHDNSVAYNIIAYNLGNGVNVLGTFPNTVNNEVTDNSIFSNGKLGINLGADGVLPNHTGTVAGPNANQNYPVLTSAEVTPGQMDVLGTLNSTANASFYVEYYASDERDPSGFGEGKTYLGRQLVTTDVLGNVALHFSARDPGYGKFLSAIAISSTDNTSEFSKSIVVKGASIVGAVISDANGNGKADDTEKGLGGRTVFADLDRDGRISMGDITTNTDSKGNYRLFGVPEGAVRVRLSGNAGWTQTFPAQSAAFRDVTVAEFGVVKGVTFGQQRSTGVAAALAVDAGNIFNIYDDLNGQKYSADKGFTGGTEHETAFGVAGTDEDPLFFTYRSGSSFSYSNNVANGTYTLQLLFADPSSTTAGQRKFNVSANGKQILKNFDIVAATGPRKALIKSFKVNVTDGKLTLNFTGVVGLALISGFKLIPD